MNGPKRTQNKKTSVPKPRQEKRAIRLDDLIPNEKVLGGRRVIFGVRTTKKLPASEG